jgi:hypothetical protein
MHLIIIAPGVFGGSWLFTWSVAWYSVRSERRARHEYFRRVCVETASDETEWDRLCRGLGPKYAAIVDKRVAARIAAAAA